MKLTNFFKKMALITYIMLSGAVIFAQIDSATFYEVVKTGGQIANTIYPKTWIKGVSNEIISGIIVFISSFVFGIFHRKKTIKKWKDEGTIVDKDLKS